MQSDFKQICKITSERTDKPEQTYKDVGSFVFQQINILLRKPPSLRLSLKGIGIWYLRRMRMRKMISYFPAYYEIEGYNDFPSENAFLKFTNKKELYDLFKERLKDYDAFMIDRAETRRQRDEYELLHPTIKREDQGSEAS